MSSAENIVRLLKYSLKASNAWSALQSGKLSIFQADFIIQSIVSSLNSRPLCVINKKLISPSYMQNLMFEKAYSEDILAELPFISQTEKAQKFKHLLDEVHTTVDTLHRDFALKIVPTLLSCKNIPLFKYKRGDSIRELEIGCLIVDPVTYSKTYDIRHSIFQIVWLSSDKRWSIICRHSYDIRNHEVGSSEYKKAIKQIYSKN